MAAALAEVADAVAARILDGLVLTGDDRVEVHWELFTPLDGLDAVKGRQVWVTPGGYGTDGPATRAEDLREFGVAVVVAERFPDPGTPPKDWVAERVGWVEANVFEKVGQLDAETPELLGGVWWPQTADVLTPADHEMLRKGVFWSELLFTFRRME